MFILRGVVTNKTTTNASELLTKNTGTSEYMVEHDFSVQQDGGIHL